MPVEFRKIVFSEAELRSALVEHGIRHRIMTKDASVSAMDLSWDADGVTVVLTCQMIGRPSREEIRMSESEIGAALIGYCRNNGTAIPHYAEKVLEKDKQGIALLIHHSWKDSLANKPPKG